MTSFEVIDALYRNIDEIDPLFKPVQKGIIRKLKSGESLNENEKRYVRGHLGKKINALEYLLNTVPRETGFLIGLSDYYITGFEALKHNGFGWSYDTKTITVINTRLKGTVDHHGKRIRLVRVKTLSNREFVQDPATGLNYATNEQIHRDAGLLHSTALERAWWSMFERYPDIFVKDKSKYKARIGQRTVDINDFGV